MATKLGLYNLALLALGERKIASLTENREPRRALDDAYDSAVAFCLSQGQWNFAAKAVEIAASASVDPPFGYAYAFEKPDDFVRTMGISSGEYFDPPLTRYQDEGDYWYADVDPIYVRYVSDDAEWGMDLTKWTPAFERYVAAHLAAEVCERLTQSATKADRLEKKAQRALLQARSIDAMNEAPGFPPAGSWARSRTGRAARRYDRA